MTVDTSYTGTGFDVLNLTKQGSSTVCLLSVLVFGHQLYEISMVPFIHPSCEVIDKVSPIHDPRQVPVVASSGDPGEPRPPIPVSSD